MRLLMPSTIGGTAKSASTLRLDRLAVLVAIDTSVLVAAAVAVHPQHQRATSIFNAVRDGSTTGCACHHALAETYSVLTKLPLVHRISPVEARAYIEAARGFVSTTPLTEQTYVVALDRCAVRGFGSGAIFDALHLVAAEEVGADVMVTFNERDFVRLAKPEGPRIASSVM